MEYNKNTLTAESLGWVYLDDEQKKNISKLISELMNSYFYGSLEINFENGKIVHCKKTEGIKI